MGLGWTSVKVSSLMRSSIRWVSPRAPPPDPPARSAASPSTAATSAAPQPPADGPRPRSGRAADRAPSSRRTTDPNSRRPRPPAAPAGDAGDSACARSVSLDPGVVAVVRACLRGIARSTERGHAQAERALPMVKPPTSAPQVGESEPCPSWAGSANVTTGNPRRPLRCPPEDRTSSCSRGPNERRLRPTGAPDRTRTASRAA